METKRIYIDKLYKNDLEGESLSVAVPFPKGELKKEMLSHLVIEDTAKPGKRLPIQMKVTATWEDDSVKFLFIRFMADVPGNSKMVLELKEVSDTEDKSEETLRVKSTGKGIAVDTGVVCFEVCDNLDSIFQNVKFADTEYVKEQFVGPILTKNGTDFNINTTKWEIVEEGPVVVILETKAVYDDKSICNIRLTAFAGKAFVDVSVRLFNESDSELIPESWKMFIKRNTDVTEDMVLPDFNGEKIDSTGCGDMNKTNADENKLFFYTTGTTSLGEMEEDISKNSSNKIRTVSGISNYKTRFMISGNGDVVGNRVTGPFLVTEANEHFGEVLYGTLFADCTDEKAGVCGSIFQAQQNFPKAVKADKNGICVYLIPEGDEKVVFSQGMAREQRFLLHFHDSKTTIEEIDDRSLVYQMPVQPWISPEEFRKAAVFPNIVTDMDKANADVELAMISRADNHGRAYGMMNWGDFPDFNYTSQGRGGGKLVWTNNEYDYPHAMFMMYARTGVRRFHDYASVAAHHWMDVDVCHFSSDELRIGGQWEHTAGHNAGGGENGVMVCSHEWVEGLLDLWHFDGDERALETALGIGENVLRLLETPMYQKAGEASARETGWALRTLTALYIETHDTKWLGSCKNIITQFKQWNERYGAWLSPYTDNTVIRVGFMISVAVGSLMRYYRQFPQDDIKELILTAIDDIAENGMNPYGLFYYKELPSLSRNGNNTLLLEAMYIGYELTGDKKYLECGLKTFWNSVNDAPSNGGGKRVVEDAVLVGSAPTKSFAQSFLPMMQFYNALIQENMIAD
ncbi:MAG: hypothetical protein K6A23_15705 [Butyrivibrio sp.]|nr:hypothetical protein [Butyrivibrio sp.]